MAATGNGLARNIRRVAHLDLPGGGQVVVQDGYVYIGHMKPPYGTTILDVRDPKNPHIAAQIMLAGDVGDAGWGGIYTLATSASALAMVFAGALTDRFRVRALAPFVLGGLALSCAAMALVGNAATLIVVVFGLRFFGQGMAATLMPSSASSSASSNVASP